MWRAEQDAIAGAGLAVSCPPEEHMPLDRELLEAALIGFERRRTALDERIAELRSGIGDRVPARTATDAVEALPQRHPECRRTPAQWRPAQRKRWAAVRQLRRAAETSGTAKGRLPQKARRRRRL